MHMLVHTQYTAAVHVGRLCVARSVFRLCPSPALPSALKLFMLLNIIFPRRRLHKHIRVIQNNERNTWIKRSANNVMWTLFVVVLCLIHKLKRFLIASVKSELNLNYECCWKQRSITRQLFIWVFAQGCLYCMSYEWIYVNDIFCEWTAEGFRHV